MAENTAISWTDHTFNPWWGCHKVSPACDHCYAERDAKRFAAGRVLWGVDAERRTFGDKHWAEPLKWNAAAQRDGVRRRVFCASMADVFDKNAPDGARDRLWQLIAATPALDWLLLTKRIGNAAAMMPANFGGQGFSNVWLGATVVNQEEANRDIPKLLAVPARVRFLSIEPMLGPVDLSAIRIPLAGESFMTANVLDRPVPLDRRRAPVTWLDWIIVGGESGPHARPTPVPWLRSIVQQCKVAGVAVHVKQLGAQPRQWCAARVHADPSDDADCDDDFCDFYEAHEQGGPCPGRCAALAHTKGGDPAEWPEELRVQEVPSA